LSEEENATQDGRRERMQRIRVGLTGLAVVLIIAVLSTIVITSTNQSSGVVAGANVGEEPLADLGVAPSTPENHATPPLPKTKAAKP
jgi:hypothetical protein